MRDVDSGIALTATLHYRGGLQQVLVVPSPVPDGILFEGEVSRGVDARPGDARYRTPSAHRTAILFRYDSVTTEQGLHYQQDSRWPPRAYVLKRTCDVCKKERAWYFIRSLWPNELPTDVKGSPTSTVHAYCEECYASPR